jgi:LmbE family N-acetylglucosaminyl deacetylase
METTSYKPIALAAAAHPDDIEFMMAGTLLLLKEAGADIHMWNLASGHCGSTRQNREEIVRVRWQEAQESARIAEATLHPPLFDDFAIFYDAQSLARVAAVIREIKPSIILTQSPQDYMEDHQNACRLIVTAAFCRGMPNFATQPTRSTYETPVALYHALPHGLCDGLRNRIVPDSYVNIESVLKTKREMLASHQSQKEWLEVSQAMNAYVTQMENMSREVGFMSGCFQYAEGWRQHRHLGFGPEQFNPLRVVLAERYTEADQRPIP